MNQIKPKNAKVKTLYLQGLEGQIAEVEASIFQGLPSFDVVGLGDSSIREAKERVRASIRSCGYVFPNQRLLVNISPAYLHKSGSSFDLAIAIAILLASGQISSAYRGIVVYGELSLTGQVRPIPGSVSRLLCLQKEKDQVCIVPSKDASEAAILDVFVHPVDSLIEAIHVLSGEETEKHVVCAALLDQDIASPSVDISTLRGQPQAERALVLAACGFHNMLLCGSPGTGKSLSAQILQGILPPLSLKEKIELLRVESAISVLSEENIASMQRPFRYVHHTCTPSAMVGGGRNAVPGEISRALHGILFLDELPEFPAHVLDLLRVPLESGEIKISRNQGTHVFPANFLLVAAMNPCRCGKLIESPSECTCTRQMIRNYQGRISGPLLDRMDIYCYLGHISKESMLESMKGEYPPQSRIWQNRISEIWARQYMRCDEAKIPRCRNGEMRKGNLGEIFRIGHKELEYAAMAASSLHLSVRGLQRMIRLSRTIADLEESKDVKLIHLTEALSYRLPLGSDKGEDHER